MHPQLSNLIARETRAELAFHAEQYRLANEVPPAGSASSPRRHVRRLVATGWIKARQPGAAAAHATIAPLQGNLRCDA